MLGTSGLCALAVHFSTVHRWMNDTPPVDLYMPGVRSSWCVHRTSVVVWARIENDWCLEIVSQQPMSSIHTAVNQFIGAVGELLASCEEGEL